VISTTVTSPRCSSRTCSWRASPAASSASSIYRFNRFTSATVSAGLEPGSPVGDGIAALDEIAERTLPEGIRTSLAGQSRDFATLWLFGQTLNVFSQIGLIMLIGLVTKNGILIVEFANQRKRAGLSVHEAVRDAACARLRRILMTSAATFFGALPIALPLGAAVGSRQSLGIAVAGGLLFSTALTLYLVPAVYEYVSRESVPETEPALPEGAARSEA
jgi:multidrug efflux pump